MRKLDSMYIGKKSKIESALGGKRTEEPQAIQEGEQQSTFDKFEEMARLRIVALFKKSPEEKVEEINSEIKPILDIMERRGVLKEGEATFLLNLALENVGGHNEEKFTNSVMIAIRPILEMKSSNPKEYERIVGKTMNERYEFTPVNDSLSYGISGSVLHIHVSPSKSLSLKEKLNMIRTGFPKLAEVLRQNDNIKEVVGTSWIVAEKPGLLKKMGFDVVDIDEETRTKHFVDETKEIKKATISREEFLKRYG